VPTKKFPYHHHNKHTDKRQHYFPSAYPTPSPALYIPRFCLHRRWQHVSHLPTYLQTVTIFTVTWVSQRSSKGFLGGSLQSDRLRNDLLCVGRGVKLYSLTLQSECFSRVTGTADRADWHQNLTVSSMDQAQPLHRNFANICL